MGNGAGERIAIQVLDGSSTEVDSANDEGTAGIDAYSAAEGEHIGAAAANVGERAPVVAGVQLRRARHRHNLAECYADVDGVALAVLAIAHVVGLDRWCGVINSRDVGFQVLYIPVVIIFAGGIETDNQGREVRRQDEFTIAGTAIRFEILLAEGIFAF